MHVCKTLHASNPFRLKTRREDTMRHVNHLARAIALTVGLLCMAPAAMGQAFSYDTTQSAWIGIELFTRAKAVIQSCPPVEDVGTTTGYSCIPLTSSTVNRELFYHTKNRSATNSCGGSSSTADNDSTGGAGFKVDTEKILAFVSGDLDGVLSTYHADFQMCPGSANTPTASALLMMNAYDISDDENCDYTYSTEQVDGVIKVPFTVSAPGDYAELKITHSVFIFLGNAIIADIASTWYIKAQNNPAIEYVCTDDGFGNCDSIIDSGSRGVICTKYSVQLDGKQRIILSHEKPFCH